MGQTRILTCTICPVVAMAVSMLLLAGTAGCPAVNHLPAPGRVLTQRAPQCHRPYYLYVPSYYSDQRSWPLVVICHGTRPFDTAKLQLADWKGLAEKEGFMVAIPELEGTAAKTAGISDSGKQIARQRADERTILSVVRAVKASRSIDETQVFLTGWSAGGYAVLYTGLRHPEVFRALAVRQGNFNAAYVEPCVPMLDPYQPIQISYGSGDLLVKEDGLKSVAWLREHGMSPTVLERPGSHRRELAPVFAFFKRVIQKQPWIHLDVQPDPNEPMQVRFETRATFEPKRYRWDFGDGTGSDEPSPLHRYEAKGTYTVRVALWASGERYHVRKIQLHVPRTFLGQPIPTP